MFSRHVTRGSGAGKRGGSARVPEVRARRKTVVILAMEGMVDRWNKSGFWCGKRLELDWNQVG